MVKKALSTHIYSRQSNNLSFSGDNDAPNKSIESNTTTTTPTSTSLHKETISDDTNYATIQSITTSVEQPQQQTAPTTTPPEKSTGSNWNPINKIFNKNVRKYFATI